MAINFNTKWLKNRLPWNPSVIQEPIVHSPKELTPSEFWEARATAITEALSIYLENISVSEDYLITDTFLLQGIVGPVIDGHLDEAYQLADTRGLAFDILSQIITRFPQISQFLAHEMLFGIIVAPQAQIAELVTGRAICDLISTIMYICNANKEQLATLSFSKNKFAEDLFLEN